MRTRHLSITVTAYDDGSYALAYLHRDYVKGKQASRSVVARRAADRASVVRLAMVAVEAMVAEEDERRSRDGVDQGESGDGPEERAAR